MESKAKMAGTQNENEAQSRGSLHRLVSCLGELAKQRHYYCDDCWYSCPLAPDGCCNDDYPEDECNCGASKHNAEVEKLLQEINAAIQAANAADEPLPGDL